MQHDQAESPAPSASGRLIDLMQQAVQVSQEQNEMLAEITTSLRLLGNLVKGLDEHLHIVFANTEERFNVMQLHHDLILKELSRIHGEDDARA